MGNDTEAHNKVAGNDNLMQDATVSINGKALLSKTRTADHFVTELLTSTSSLSVQDRLAAHHDILGLIKKCLCE